MNIEICVANIDDIEILNNYNIARIELNQALSVGGLTPSYNLVKEALKISKHKIITMLRPREGDFNYSDNEFNLIIKDATTFLELGVDGIVFGFLNKDKSIDIFKTKKLINLAKKYNKEAIFHRAIDVSNNYIENIKLLTEMGIDRILTSGSKNTAIEAIDILSNLKNYPIIIASGINPENIHIFKKYAFKEIHASFSEIFKNNYNIDFGAYLKLSQKKLLSIDNISF